MTAEETSEHVEEARSTAPQSPFTTWHVLVGIVIFLIGIVIVGAIPVLGTW